MRSLFFDLQQDATRVSLYTRLLDEVAGAESLTHRECTDPSPQEDFTGCAVFATLAKRKGAAGIAEALSSAGIPDRHHHDLLDLLSTIDGLQVSERVKADMRGIYTILAEAEAQVHGCPVEKTHFHEVGNAASICNALGICLAIEALDPAYIVASPVQVGSGTVQCAHGLLDIPAPATAAILKGIPLSGKRLAGEWCTPTSAAIIKHFVDRFEEA